MIVCLCHRVRDRDIQQAVRDGTTSFELLQDDTRVASSCGCCYDCAREVFDAACGQQTEGAQPSVLATAT
jgi:bacterioferritin-associated ferredoxin